MTTPTKIGDTYEYDGKTYVVVNVEEVRLHPIEDLEAILDALINGDVSA